MTSPLYRRPPAERRAIAEQFVGHTVRLAFDPQRGNTWDGNKSQPQTYTGRLLSVARPIVGTVADLAILRYRTDAGGLTDAAFSLASIASIDPIN